MLLLTNLTLKFELIFVLPHESQSFEILNIFNVLILKQVSKNMKTLFEILEYHFLVESTSIQSETFPYKLCLSEANFKTENGEYKMNLSQRRQFLHQLLNFLRI